MPTETFQLLLSPYILHLCCRPPPYEYFTILFLLRTSADTVSVCVHVPGAPLIKHRPVWLLITLLSSQIIFLRHTSASWTLKAKIFFSVVAHRLTTFLERNHYIDTMVYMALIPGFAGCLEHANMILHQIQTTKKEGGDLYVVFLDLFNASASFPHSLLWSAFDYFRES